MSIADFQPNSEEERLFIEAHSSMSKVISMVVRTLPKENRVAAINHGNPSDTTLLALYLWAMKQEDYETCEAAKVLIEERGIPITKWPYS
jgi:hypothetical protein